MVALVWTESIHAIWQIYGNMIYYNPSLDKKVIECKEQNNAGFIFSMYLIVLLGYVYFLIYFVLILLVSMVYLRRFTNRRSRISESAQIIRSISRVQFSEELFGAISDENECIICMTAFNQADMITKLNCEGSHFYHTNCIENWIKQGSNQCPMCRQPINEEIQLQSIQANP